MRWKSWPLRSMISWFPFWRDTQDLQSSRLSTKTRSSSVDLNQYIVVFKNPGLPIKVVANLSLLHHPIPMQFWSNPRLPFQEFVVMMQKDVADRIRLSPTPLMVLSPLQSSLLYDCWGVAFYCTSHRLCRHQTSTSPFVWLVRREQSSSSQGWRFLLLSSSKASFCPPSAKHFGTILDQFTLALDRSQAGSSSPSCSSVTSVRGELPGPRRLASLSRWPSRSIVIQKARLATYGLFVS